MSLFSWIPQGLRYILVGLLYLSLTILFFIMLAFIVSKLFMAYFSHDGKIVSAQWAPLIYISAFALAGVAQWIEPVSSLACEPQVIGSIPR